MVSQGRTDHYVVECIPPYAPFLDQGCSNQRRNGGAQRITRLQEPRDFIRVRHVADPSTPSCVNKAVAETDENKHYHEHRVGRVDGEDYVGD